MENSNELSNATSNSSSGASVDRNRSKQFRKHGSPNAVRRDGIDYVNVSEEDQMEIYGYQHSLIHKAITWILMIATLGLLRLLFHWKPHWMLICSHKRCKLKDATKVLLIDCFRQIYVENVEKIFSPTLPSIKTPNRQKNFYSPWSSSPVVLKNSYGSFKEIDCVTYFENKNLRYIWLDDKEEFVKLTGLDVNVDCSFFYKQKGLSSLEQQKRLQLFGPNCITVQVQTILQVLFNEVLEPFYVFQIFSILLWCFDDYYYYASCILIMSALSLGSSLIQIRRNQQQLQDTVQGVGTVTVCRGGDEYEEIESSKLVPGDVIIIPPYGCVMQCDAVLISGNAIVNESMLTGESVPVTKIPLLYHENDFYNAKEHAKHTLFCGTKVIQTRYYDSGKVRGVVIRTGFLTSKGELIRSIMFPKPVDFHFNRHIFKFILCLATLAGIGFTYTVVLNLSRGMPAGRIIVKALDLITVVVPPALPVAMTIGVIYAQSRLKSSNIYCISPRSINISGCVNCVCFDKTGTLTEDDLSFFEVIPVDKASNRFGFPLRSLPKLENKPILTSLAACHSLTIIGDNLVGDPLDLKMFQATGWVLEEPDIEEANKFDLLAPTIVRPGPSRDSGDEAIFDTEVGIIRQFPFSSSLQRMSVITRTLGEEDYVLYSKGAPEMISKLCLKGTIPTNFSYVLMEYTEKGYRVLALAQKVLRLPPSKIHRAAREKIERDMEFLGLLVMSNVLKPETTFVIQTLSTANIRSVMITGDNMLTALSVGRESMMIKPNDQVVLLEAIEHESCDLSPPLLTWRYANTSHHQSPTIEYVKLHMEAEDNLHVAVTGKTFRILREYYPDLLNKVAIRGTIFARMGPEQKQQLIELLQDLGYYVGMCGDGANDCGALKAAHAGISLSDTEASVASPFTSKTPNISCVPILIREGRASLVTAFGILKYMACYSLAQFISVIILYSVWSNLSDMEYLYIDLFLISVFFMLFGRTESFTELSKHPPPSSLIGIVPLSSLALQVLLIIVFQLSALLSVWAQPWYQPHIPLSNDDYACHDNYAIFAVSVFQYISLAIVFSKGAPYRKPIISNSWFMLSILIMTAITTYLILIPHPWIAKVMELHIHSVSMKFRFWCLILALINFGASYFVESYVVDYLIHEKFKSRNWKKGFHFKKPYQRIDRMTRNTTSWLPPKLSISRNFSDLQVNGIISEIGDDLEFHGKNSLDNNGISSKESNSESGISLSSPASMASERV